MPHYRLREAATLLGVSDDTIRRWGELGRLPITTDQQGRQVIDGVTLAHFAEKQWQDPDNAEWASSARNHFTGLVTRVISDRVMSQVELQCGPHRITSLVSTEAVSSLGLEPGVLATAVVKSTNVIINRNEKSL